MMTRLILVRHCEAYGNIKRVFNGISNGDITENGAIQLSFLSERAKDFDIDYIYSSPLLRAVKTAKAFNKYHKLPIHICNDLIEINGGKMENQLFSDFPVLFPEESRKWNLEPWNFSIENGESMEDLFDRISKCAVKIAKRHQDNNIVLASHGCAIRNLLCWAKGWDITKLNDVNWCDNTAISVIELDSNFSPNIVLENDSSHLPENISTLYKQTWWKKENINNLVFDD